MPSARPETRYAKSGGLNVAYQVVGQGPFDLVYVPGWVSNIEAMWDEPGHARLLDRLAAFSRLILFDKRGTGLSDPIPLDRPPTLEQRMDDVRAVMDAAGSKQRSSLRVVRRGSDDRALRCDVPRADTGACHARDLREAALEPGLPVGADGRREGRGDRRDRAKLGWRDGHFALSRRAPTRRSSGVRSTTCGGARALGRRLRSCG